MCMRVDMVSWMRQLLDGKVDVEVIVIVTVAVKVTVTEFVAVIVAESVTVGLHLYFRVTGW
jgi:hypothetical protein